MTIREINQRQHLIIRRLKQRPSTFKELQEYLQQESEIRGEDLNLSYRTFARDRQNIFSAYGIEITHDAKERVYKVNDALTEESEERMLEAFDLIDVLGLHNELSGHVLFSRRHKQGTENMYSLLQAAKKEIYVEFDYQKYFEREPTRRRTAPYALKEFKNRWYVLARDKKDGRVKTFALDRLFNLHVTSSKIETDKKVDPAEYFRYSFGIETIDEEPREVILSFGSFQGKYIKSLPFHPSQEILIDNDEEFRIKLYILLTHDFMLELLSYGANVKVIAPDELIERLKEHYEGALKQYGG